MEALLVLAFNEFIKILSIGCTCIMEVIFKENKNQSEHKHTIIHCFSSWNDLICTQSSQTGQNWSVQ